MYWAKYILPTPSWKCSTTNLVISVNSTHLECTWVVSKLLVKAKKTLAWNVIAKSIFLFLFDPQRKFEIAFGCRCMFAHFIPFQQRPKKLSLMWNKCYVCIQLFTFFVESTCIFKQWFNCKVNSRYYFVLMTHSFKSKLFVEWWGLIRVYGRSYLVHPVPF